MLSLLRHPTLLSGHVFFLINYYQVILELKGHDTIIKLVMFGLSHLGEYHYHNV